MTKMNEEKTKKVKVKNEHTENDKMQEQYNKKTFKKDKKHKKSKAEKKNNRNEIIFRTVSLIMCISLVFVTIASCIYYIINQ